MCLFLSLYVSFAWMESHAFFLILVQPLRFGIEFRPVIGVDQWWFNFFKKNFCSHFFEMLLIVLCEFIYVEKASVVVHIAWLPWKYRKMSSWEI